MTERRKTPQEKKAESYKQDRVEGGEYPHADRKNRPLVKALGQRQYRRTANQILASQPEEAMILPDERAKPGWSKSSLDLPMHLEQTRYQRVSREANNLFREGYNTETHSRFGATLRTWMEGDTEYLADLAAYYHGVLNGFPEELRPVLRRTVVAGRREFLERFFKLEPELKIAFEEWITKRRQKTDA